MPQMVRIEGVTLARTGSYLLSTGPATFTEEDLVAAVAAVANDPAVHAPRVKIDGLGESFDPEAHGGEPALGWVEDMVVTANGQELTGTLVVPEWLSEVADFAYPNRSIEGAIGARTATGQQHDLLITAVALLGVDLPGISTLPDLAEFLANGPAGAAPDPQAIMAAAGWTGTAVRAGMDQEIVRRRLMDWLQGGADGVDLPEENESVWDLWPVALRFDDQGQPYAKVLDEGTGRLYRVDVSVSGNEVTFGEFVEVMEQDVPVAAAAGSAPTGQVWASRADVRPTPPTEENDVDISAIREAAGLTAEQLPDDATPEQVAAALRTAPAPAEVVPPAPAAVADPTSEPTPPQSAAPAEPEAAPEPVAAAAGTVNVSAEVWNETNNRVQRLEAAETAREQAATKTRRDQIVKDALRATRIAYSEKDHYRKLLDVNEEQTAALLAGLAPGRVPTAQIAAEEAADQQVADNQGTGLFPTLAKRED